ncbi:MAG: glycoside hydrolase family 5 protein [Treponema sp.]|jgi:endoglucanase|nr:glycoside hydrolase family 5 protein [Treponema sp.]
MKKNWLMLLAAFVIYGFIFASCASVEDGDYMRDMTTAEVIFDMGLGINLGNTLEAVSPWVSNATIASLETSWGSVRITKQIIEGYKAAGFNTLRIPVAWSNLMNMRNYTINPNLLDRVQEIVDWTLEAGMYAIINLHWDGGWINKFPQEYNESMKRYTKIWEQVARRFRNYNDYLLFESQNEELGWNSLWNQWGEMTPDNLAGKAREYEIVNAINQRFVNIVRSSGGNNGKRHLLIAGYNTNIDRTVDPLYKMPNDPANRMAVKVHYYDPFGFTHLTKDESWAQARWTWGTESDFNALNNELNKMKINFIDKGIPVVIGEYGVAKQGLTQEEITKYTLEVTRAMFSLGMAPMLWCVQLQTDQLNFYYNRRIPGMTDPALESGMKAIAVLR